MSKAINLAKLTLAFLIIAGGFSIIVGSLMGGGSSRSSYDKARVINKDPRSILVQAVFVETDSNGADFSSLPAPGAALTDSAFNSFMSDAEEFRAAGEARVRTPALLIQHAESGSISVSLGDRSFDADISPSVIDTKHGPVLRVALQIHRVDIDSSNTTQGLRFSTAYTSAQGGAVVLDLAGLGIPGARSVLALRTSLIDPTPMATN